MMLEKLWESYSRTRSDELRNRLIMHYLHLAHYHTNRQVFGGEHNPLYYDVLGAAYWGLMRAVELYDIDSQIKFETFSAFRIKGAIQDWFRGRKNRTIHDFQKRREAAEDKLRADGDIVDIHDLATEMNLSLSAYLKLDKLTMHSQKMPLLPSMNQECKDEEYDDVYEKLYSFLGDLSAQHRLILVLRFFEGLSMIKISKFVGLSTARVYQLYDLAMNELREKMAA